MPRSDCCFAIPGLGDVAKGGDLIKDAGKLLKSLGPDILNLQKRVDPRELLKVIREGKDALVNFIKKLTGKAGKETEKELNRLVPDAAQRDRLLHAEGGDKA